MPGRQQSQQQSGPGAAAGVGAALEAGAGVGRQFQQLHPRGAGGGAPRRTQSVRRPVAGPIPRKVSGAVGPDTLARSSLRSKASSGGGASSSGSKEKDRKKAFKDFCRAAVLFLFTQVTARRFI